MEDFAPVIWVLVIIGAAAYGSFSQARKKGREGHEKHGHGEAWPSWDPTSAPESESEDQREEQAEAAPRARQMHREEHRQQPTHGQRAEFSPKTAEYEHEAYSLEAEHPAYGQASETTDYAFQSTVTVKAGAHGAHEQTPDAFTEDTEAAPALSDEEFDVRKAVIYSEILKPKFDE